MSRNIKNNYNPDLLSLVIWVGFYLCLFASCTTREPGCLDTAASNYDLDAERSCDDCCTYPNLTLTLSQKWADRNFNAADTFFDSNQNPYLLLDIKYFLSSWKLTGDQGQLLAVDSTTIECNGTDFNFIPDQVIIDSRQFNYTIGTIRTSPLIDTVMFKVGIEPGIQCATTSIDSLPGQLTKNSSLFDKDEAALAAVRLIVRRFVPEAVDDTLYIHTCLPVTLPLTLGPSPGENAHLEVTVDYATWFEGVNANDLQTFISTTMNHAIESFYATP